MIQVAKVRRNDDPQKDYIVIMLEFEEVLPNGQHGYVIKYSNTYVSRLKSHPKPEKDCVKRIYELRRD